MIKTFSTMLWTAEALADSGGLRRQTSALRHQASGLCRPASGTRNPKPLSAVRLADKTRNLSEAVQPSKAQYNPVQPLLFFIFFPKPACPPALRFWNSELSFPLPASLLSSLSSCPFSVWNLELGLG